ncbi:hypothetical protein FA04_33145 (plasmid) [Ensifer adhaerens]|nr:hypothetical protein FA04_33145 [Ensifer adhaerens]KQX31525.1 hypothetical protein ASD01_18700 [Ensifer sp. Root423]KQX52268.1 hypothetical protein ASD49_30540 [Ensifer sp. Root1298]KQX85470.1 hypothetical protein ASD41_29910 [Ensifer sp. Root1312]KQZ54175.1 hypothetical protein ASD63_27435 [Ensifer sp. Root558]KRC24631.1 hypothetical protein ASE29_26955 [Ensifer sp. Root74]KRD76132.1 hypothetical protein ASE71_03210 [Ensifer sp. Root954]
MLMIQATIAMTTIFMRHFRFVTIYSNTPDAPLFRRRAIGGSLIGGDHRRRLRWCRLDPRFEH